MLCQDVKLGEYGHVARLVPGFAGLSGALIKFRDAGYAPDLEGEIVGARYKDFRRAK